MSRPLPTIPRGAKRRSPPPQVDRIVFRCPSVSPEYELRAFIALVKPQFKRAVTHRSGRQVLPRAAGRIVGELIANLGPRVAARTEGRVCPADDNLLQIEFDPRDARRARALAIDISTRFASLWFFFNDRLLHGGRFYRRQGRYRLVPVSLRVPRLPRELFLTMVGATDAGQDDPDSPRDDPDP